MSYNYDYIIMNFIPPTWKNIGRFHFVKGTGNTVPGFRGGFQVHENYC